MSDIETLQSWCHWKLKEKDLSEDDRDFAKAVQDLISQVGTWKAKYEQLRAERDDLQEALRHNKEAHAVYDHAAKEIDQLRAENEKLKRALDRIGNHCCGFCPDHLGADDYKDPGVILARSIIYEIQLYAKEALR